MLFTAGLIFLFAISHGKALNFLFTTGTCWLYGGIIKPMRYPGYGVYDLFALVLIFEYLYRMEDSLLRRLKLTIFSRILYLVHIQTRHLLADCLDFPLS
jgi:hypothetical protein